MVRPRLHGPSHRDVTVTVGRESPRPDDGFVNGHDFDRDRAFATGVAASQRRRSTAVGRYGLRWCHAASTSSRRTWLLPVLVIPPWERDAPEECSDGTRPR